MNRDELIEKMAKGIDPAAWNTRAMEGIPDYKGRQEVSKFRADAALTALEAAGVALVPVKPTGKMIGAAMDKLDTPFFADLEVAYEAMLAASPYRRDSDDK